MFDGSEGHLEDPSVDAACASQSTMVRLGQHVRRDNVEGFVIVGVLGTGRFDKFQVE